MKASGLAAKQAAKGKPTAWAKRMPRAVFLVFLTPHFIKKDGGLTMTKFLSFKAAKDTDLWLFCLADAAGGILDEEDSWLGCIEVKLGRKLTASGAKFRMPSFDGLSRGWVRRNVPE